MTEVDMVRHPPHYNKYSIEVIEVTRHCSFDIGNAIKYMLRHLHKGTSKQDLEKALWYVNDHRAHWPDSTVLIPDATARENLAVLMGEYLQLPDALGQVANALHYIYLDRPDLAVVSLTDAVSL